MKKVLLLGVALLLLWLLVPANSVAASPAVEIEKTWANDVEWEMLVPIHQPEPMPSNMKSHEEIWIIGAINPGTPQSPGHGAAIGAHDHVIAPPPHNKGDYTAIWHVMVVVPGPKAIPGVNVRFRWVVPPGAPLVYQVNYGAGWINLTSREKVETAVTAGLVAEIDTGFAFLCSVRPIKP